MAAQACLRKMFEIRATDDSRRCITDVRLDDDRGKGLSPRSLGAQIAGGRPRFRRPSAKDVADKIAGRAVSYSPIYRAKK